MSSDSRSPQSLTGHWSGEFAYPNNLGPLTPFVAKIEDEAGHLTGTIIEPNIIDGGTIEATIWGTRHGTSCDFTKTYTAIASAEYGEPIDYVGNLSSDGLTVKGVWSMLDWDGTFEMRRDTHSMEERTSEEEVGEQLASNLDA